MIIIMMVELITMVDSVMTNVDDVKKLISIILIIILIIQCIFNLHCPFREVQFTDTKHTKNLPCV